MTQLHDAVAPGMKGASAGAEEHEFGRASVAKSGRHMARSSWLGRLSRRLGFWHYFDYIEKYVPSGARGLEFGSGGGNHWLATNYRMCGLEYGFTSARASAQVFGRSVNADATSVPFADKSFDFVCSCFVLEHLPDDAAAKMFREMRRVLRPNGRFIALMDLHCDRPSLRRLRERHPIAYRESMIDYPGHYGLRSSSQVQAIAEASGFVIKAWRLESRVPISDLGTYACLCHAPSAPRHLRILGRTALWLAGRSPWGSLYQFGLTALDDLCGAMFPRTWAYRLLFVLERVDERGEPQP